MKECLHENQSLIRLHRVSLFHFLEQVVGTCKIKIEKFLFLFCFILKMYPLLFLYIYINLPLEQHSISENQKKKNVRKKNIDPKIFRYLTYMRQLD